MSNNSKTVAIVTGGSRGLGEAFARQIVAEGGKVAIADVLDAEGTALASELGSNAIYVHLDVTELDDWAKAVEATEKAFGSITGLVNNAGILVVGGVLDTTEEGYDKIVAVNQKGVIFGMQSVVPSMKKAGRGSIVNISSIAGIQGYAGMIPYVGSKWAVRGITKAAALELVSDKILVNSIHPGSFRTDMTAPFEAVENPYAGIPAGRFGTPAELAGLVAWLLSEDNGYATGSEFVVDGGVTAG